MTKKLALIWILALLGSAGAVKPANCAKTVGLYSGSLHYTSLAKFPDPEEEVSLDFLDRWSPVASAEVCGVKFKADPSAKTLTASAPDLGSIARVFSSRAKGQLSISTGFPNQLGKATPVDLLYDLKGRTVSFKNPGDLITTFVIAVKVDGGALQPLYYNGKMTPVRIPPSAGAFDLYVRMPTGAYTAWERVGVNLKKPGVVLYKEARFPAK